MKKMIIDIRELSDSKEVYGQCPNPFIPAFIYSVLGLFVIAVIYCCFGKIEIASTASGIIRPNDDVSTVSSLLSGRVTGVHYVDGQVVQKGDPLITVETAELEISLKGLKNTQTKYETQISMIDKFLDGIKKEENPFSSDASSEEYPYYVQFQDYKLSVQNKQDSYEYDAANAKANISSINTQISELKKQIEGFNAYKSSVQKGVNEASDYPEYENMYLLYVEEVNALNADYETKREQIERDSTAELNQHHMENYEKQIVDYGYLIGSIEAGDSTFPSEGSSACRLLWDDYRANLDKYKKSYEDALKVYNDYISNNTASSEDIATAKAQMERAENDISTYKNKMLAEYQQVLSDYETKKQELQITMSATQDKSALLEELENAHQNALQKKHYQTIAQVDNNIQTLQSKLIAAQSSLKQHQIASELYESSVDEHGVPISLSIPMVEQCATLLSQKENLTVKLSDLNTQIQQTEEQIAQGRILAEQSGVVNVISSLVTGDMISAGKPFATIIPLNESEFKVQLYVNNSDIANIDVGDTIRYNLPALPSNQYGMVDGIVRKISKDSLVQDGQYSGYYLVEGSIENTKLSDKDGNSGSVAIGMQVEAKIVTQRKTIIRYLFEKCNIF